MLHVWPVKPNGHLQVKPELCCCCMHVPPLKHGFDEHGFICTLQFAPVNPY